jgi:hypothetical protein
VELRGSFGNLGTVGGVRRVALIALVVAAVAGMVVADAVTLAAGRRDVTSELRAAEQGKRIAAYVKLLHEHQLDHGAHQ